MTKKTIRSPSDLAINGAPPALDEPLHVGRPNVGSRALLLGHIDQILSRQWLTNNGPVVQELERRIAERVGVRNCVAMCNGTVALEIAIRALGLTGEVIVPAFTFVATAHALHWQGVTPVFADIDPATHNLDPDAVRSAISSDTTGIIGVHLWGRGAPVSELQMIADSHGLALLFDAAHAFGCSHGDRMIGGFGRCEVFSFHATKFFNTSEGGAVVTNDDELADRLRLMRNFGFAGYDKVIHPGTNGKMPEICAALGLANFESLDAIVETNRRNYALYAESLHGVPGISLLQFDASVANNYQYVVLEVAQDCSASRDEIIAALHAENVLARRYFWPGCHRMAPYSHSVKHMRGTLHVTERIAESVVVLPTGCSVGGEAIKLITDVVRTVVMGSPS